MSWLLWFALAVAVVAVLFAGFVFLQYKRFRAMHPKPDYKHPQLKPSHHEWRDDEVTVSWVGHSTLLINLYGKKILTDPVLMEKVGVSFAGRVVGMKRHTAAALTPEEIGKADLILLSHAHLDHFDIPSLKKMADSETQVVTAKNTSRLLRGLTFGQVHELTGKESILLDNDLQITAVPVRHWGRRFPWNSEYHYTGYLIEYRGTRFFFAGDTAYTVTFRELREIGPIDIAAIPIGAYSPDSYQGSHCTPEQAWEMFLDSGAEYLVPIHWDTFVLSHEPVDEPMQRLLAAAGDETDRIIIREHGATFGLSPVREKDKETTPAT